MKNWKTKTKRKILFMVLSIAAVLIVAGDWAMTVIIYNENFDRRFESYEPLMRYVDDFDGLQRTKYEFVSDKGQKLTGYLYTSEENPRGIIVMAHGFGGGGHNSYMDCANYFAQHGYCVFAYDVTGNDESEGDGVGGLPQGVIDLDYAITFVEESGNFPDLPIVLFGHSWGGYSVCNVLTYHPEVKAVIACSGFNSSADLFEAEGKKQAGAGIYLMMPFVKLHERIKYGGYASNTAMDGFSKSDAAVMILHSFDDEVVPAEYGYDIYYEKYQDDSRFRFIHFEDKGHNYFNDKTYTDEFNAEFDKWLETLDYDYKTSENKERFSEDKADYIHKNLNREKWCNSLDLELFEEFVDFYDENIQPYSCVVVEDEYEITFYSNTNNIIFSERYPKEPRIRQITENIFEISISVGSPATYVFYVDTEHAEVSETFFNPLLFGDHCIAYMEDGKLILRDIFQDDLLYMTISREFTRTADPMSAIIAIERTDEGNITLSYYKGEDYEETSESIVITDESRQPDIFINDSMEQETETENYLKDFDIHPLYAAFLQNEIRVANPYTANELTFFDDREYGFEGPWKNFSLVDVNHDDAPELAFKITQSPSELLYIFGVWNDELICYDIFETHTSNMSFTVYDNGTVWWGQNYDGEESVGYTFTDDGKKQELIRFVREESSDSNLYYDYYYLAGNEETRFSLGSDEEYESLAASYGSMGEEPEWYDCESFADIPPN